MDDKEISERVGFLAKETIEQWTLRFHRERGLPEPSPEELKKIIALGYDDEKRAHQ